MKDYTTKTADEWFSLKKWTGYLMTLPLGRTDSRDCKSYREVLAIRSTAGLLSGPKVDCGRTFSVTTDKDDELKIFVKAEKK